MLVSVVILLLTTAEKGFIAVPRILPVSLYSNLMRLLSVL